MTPSPPPAIKAAVQKLDFIVAGSQKCGTSALSVYLAGHRALSSPARKELHFFDNEEMDWSRPDYAAYHASFAAPGMRYEITPVYLWWPGALERIRAYRPDIRLAFLFRDPAARAYSHWCMEFARGHEPLTFQQAIREGRARLAGGGHQNLRRYSYVERGFYGAQVARLLTLFPREQLLFLRAEDLALRPRVVLDRLADFAGFSRMTGVEPIRAHERKKIAYPSRLEDADVDMFAALCRDDLAEFARLTGLDISRWPTVTGARAAG